MKLKNLKDVLTFAAFRPEPDDGASPWVRRFPSERTLLLSVGKNRTSWRGLGKGGRFTEGGSQKGDFKDIAASMAPEWRRLTDNGWCNVSLNSRYVISLEANLPRKEGIEDSMRTNPRATLGAKFERTKRYALTSNPEHGTSIVLACEEEVVKKMEGTLSENGLATGRICCGAYTMLRRAIEHVNDGSRPSGAAANYVYVVCCDGSICILTQSGDAWSDLRSRADFYEEDATPALDMIAPAFRGDEGRPAEIFFAADRAGSSLPEKLAERFPDTKLTDLTTPDHLWAIISDLC